MPHIIAVFPEDPEVRGLLRTHKVAIRSIITKDLGYEMEDTALIPQAISPADQELADNLLPLEFVIESGTRTLDHEDLVSSSIVQHIAQYIPAFAKIRFGVWIKSHAKNGYTEHQPSG